MLATSSTNSLDGAPQVAEGDCTCAIVVNWNGWRDTVDCLHSLLGLKEGPLRVIVCDNGSTDGSVSELDAWLGRCLQRQASRDGVLAYAPVRRSCDALSVHVLPLPQNLGYAGGVNAGLDWAQAQWSPRGFWILNNDVQAQPGALQALLAAHARTPRAGICGSVLLDWDDPARIQAVAGMYRRWLGVGWHDTNMPRDGADVSHALDYPVGASMYVSAEYLQQVGRMDPSYVLYYEEMDWTERGRQMGYQPVVALGSRLRHKEGASTGSRGGVRHKSMLSERYGVINRLRITRKFWPYYLPLVWLSLLLVAMERTVHGERARARLVLRLMMSPRQWMR